MKKNIPIPQLTAWLTVATIAPILSLAGRIGWITVALSALICTALSACICLFRVQVPKWVIALELLWTVLLLGTVARQSATCWQDGINTSLLPLVLIISAAFAVRNGAQHGARSGAALLWFVVPGVSIILLAGIGDLQVQSLKENALTNVWTTTPLFLLPVLGRHTVKENQGKLLKCTLINVCVAVAAAVWLNAALTPQDAINAENTFYEYSKGITLFGVAERFEAVSACLLTAGWFALFAFLLASVYENVEQNRKGYGKCGMWTAAASAILVMYNLPITMPTAGVLSLIFWGVLPLTTQAIVALKKSKKYGETS